MSVVAAVFDLYGTLLDIATMREHVEDAGIPDASAFVADWRRTQLEYAFITSMAGAYEDFDALTRRALDHTCAARGVTPTAHARAALAARWRTMPAYGDVAGALRDLRDRGVARAVLTNGTPASANEALVAAGVRDLLDDLLSVDAVRAYKPDPRVYALATARFACEPRDIVFVSSNPWDAWGAARFGFRVAWCNRSGVAAAALDPPPGTTIATLSALAPFVVRAS